MINRQIALGMYSLDSKLLQAWHSLFIQVSDFYSDIDIPKVVVNSIEDSVILDNNTCISHICGLPLIDRFSQCLMPLCAPQFNLSSVSGPHYFSYYVVRYDSAMKSVADAKGKVLAVNSLCSNSGFHVLRHELKTVFNGSIEDYFCKIHYTGSHRLSIQSILEGVSEFAAIDAATYEYLCVIDPVYRTQLRIIGQSRQSTAPPLVTHKNSPFCDPQLLTKALNSALNSLDQTTRNTLNIKQFHKVELQDYTSQILD